MDTKPFPSALAALLRAILSLGFPAAMLLAYAATDGSPWVAGLIVFGVCCYVLRTLKMDRDQGSRHEPCLLDAGPKPEIDDI